MLKFSYEKLESFLTKAKKVAIMAIGNPLRGDDGVGIVVGNMIKDRVPADVYICELMPENYLTRITSGGYTHVIIIDSVRASAKPGEILLIDYNELDNTTVSISTHGLPISFTIEFLRRHDIEVLIIGIQPRDTSIREGLSRIVKKSARDLSQMLISALNGVLSKDQISSHVSGSGAHHRD